MKVHGLTVSVGYASLLSYHLEFWMDGLESLVVVTSPEDTQTRNLDGRFPAVRIYSTDAFYRSGAKFNKGAAMSEAVDRLALCSADWFLSFDADIDPPTKWLARIEEQGPRAGTAYGARRIDRATGRFIADPQPAGYFLLFHSDDPAAKIRPLFPTQYYHAGNYDTEFIERWPRENRKFLDLNLKHTGSPHENWCGIGNQQAAAQIWEHRKAGKSWRTETINAPGESRPGSVIPN